MLQHLLPASYDGGQVQRSKDFLVFHGIGSDSEHVVRAAEEIDDGTAVNLGTMERIKVMDAVHEVLRYTGHKARIETRPDMPTGPYNRVADNSLAKRLLGWEPRVKFKDGLHRTIDWYFSTRSREQVKAEFERRLTER